ncbi:MAG TPA: hypothetical protein VFD85_09170 [Gemmatimonadales bacterium]|nr:hypothetical protein [Gemmatimonadales bacterium]
MSVKLAIVVVAAAVLAAGCDQQALKVAQARADSLQNVASDHDRAVAEVAADARALSDISTEMAKVRLNGKMKIQPAETPEAARRDTVVERVRLLVSRVHSADAQLKTSRDQIASMTHLSDSLRATLESTVVNFQKVVDDQKTQIAALTARVDSLTGVNIALNDTLNATNTRDNTVYYVIGTKDDLIKRGVVTEEGGARFLFVLWKSGKTLVPARNLDPTQFTAIDQRQVTSIALPDSAQAYRIVSRNDLTALNTPPTDNGEIQNTNKIAIAKPGQFWAGSRYLIIVEG